MELLKVEYKIKNLNKPFDMEIQSLTPEDELPRIDNISESPLATPYALNFLCKTVSKYFEDKDNQKEFEKWYFERYGEAYVWKTRGSVANAQADLKK